jgi:hypothetical protein
MTLCLVSHAQIGRKTEKIWVDRRTLSTRQVSRIESFSKGVKEETTMPEANPMEVEKALKGVDYPAKKEDLIKHAQKHGADERVRKTLEKLPEETYHTPIDVTKAIGKLD